MTRIEINPLLRKLRLVLKNKWAQYQIIITSFISGKMNREEFDLQINSILKKKYCQNPRV
ncbi:unnamed protein product [Pneumocystis jirovecii]|uniref:Uncharacterized protein n=1 Tax=Pneumocystis jirovecii TaxID=42068 RepID=L0PGX2_PNEJI|nr:unnamed protein product [Pneumocystis jirovecii]